jgi:two-component system chemotaxis sensor kinase CheA
MKRLVAYLLLPPEISDFERTYLARINRIALIFFFCHVPVFMGIALLAGNSVWQAAVLTPLALIGPVVAYQTLRNPRHLSIVFGFTAMCMGGLLVHFGRGPMQIEMHFYFFVLIALLAVFANPLAIITAAVTVALHHLVLFLVLPSSVFNYSATIWGVLVHAIFVVLESVAACFVARSFFENVIGLERIVKRRTDQLSARNQDMRLVLDNVGQGFVTVNLDGTISPERSAVVDEWLGPFVADKKVWDYLTRIEASVGPWFLSAWQGLLDDLLPQDVSIAQLPRRCTDGKRTFSLEYRPVLVAGKLAKVLLVMSDVTASIERERFEAERRDFLHVFEHVMKDKKGFLEFLSEAEQLVGRITQQPPGTPEPSEHEMRRLVHTLKGNAAIFGLSRLATLCHELENNMLDRAGTTTASERERLGQLWRAFADSLHTILGQSGPGRFEVDNAEYLSVLQDLAGNVSRDEIALRLRSWQFEAAELRLGRVADQARAIAERLGKPPLEVLVEPSDLRLFPEAWSEFWSVFIHAVRNAVDHGIEPEDERVAAGKAPQGTLRLVTKLVADDLVAEISDDGRGIAWELLREKAKAVGIPHLTEDQLVEALFQDGVSTKPAVSEFSGRGIGMGAIRAACHKMGGSIQVLTTPGRGTTFRFLWPQVERRADALVFSSSHRRPAAPIKGRVQ